MAGDETVIELATSVAPDFVKLRRILKAWEADHPVEALHPEDDEEEDAHDDDRALAELVAPAGEAAP